MYNNFEYGRLSNVKTLAKVFIVLNMIALCIFIYPIIIGVISYSKINHSKSKDDLIVCGVLELVLCGNLLGSIFMFLISDDELKNSNISVSKIEKSIE